MTIEITPRTRKIYYVFTATAEQNENGTYKKLFGYLHKKRAIRLAEQQRKNECIAFVRLERHNGIDNGFAWELNTELKEPIDGIEVF